MRILTAKQIKAVEENAFKTDSTEAGLMLNAGIACFEKYAKFLEKALQTAVLQYFAAMAKMQVTAS